MTGKLPININHLLRQHTIEGERVEYKTGWNPQRVLHTICAFANDFRDLGGGYVVQGVQEQKGREIGRRYRNRRIGEFLKELELAEGRSTGVPKILRAMRQNGSLEPVFESDEDRTWFLVRLPVHERASHVATDQVTQQDKSLIKQDENRHIVQTTDQVTDQVTAHVEQLVVALTGEMSRAELQTALQLRHRRHFATVYLRPALKAA